MPAIMQNEVHHGRLIAKGDTDTIFGWGSIAGQERMKRRAKLIKAGARLRPGLQVLEIGCGTGALTEIIAETGCEIFAIDISDALIKKARKRLLPENVTFIKASLGQGRMEFDVVIGSSILHHLNLNDALPKIHGLLKPNGAICFAEPNMLNPQIFIERKLRRLFPYVSPDETAFIRWQLTKSLRIAGFQNIKIMPFDWLHPLTPRPFVGLISKAGGVIEKIPILREFAGSLLIRGVKNASNYL